MATYTVCGGKGCCLKVETKEDGVVIVDQNDAGNRMEINKADWNALVSQIREGTIKEL